MEQKYKKFKEYNFAYSSDWNNYYNNLYPPPPITKLLHYKKKFYRNYIDPDFDVDYIPPEGEKLETEYKPPPDIIEQHLKKMKKESDNNNYKDNKEKSNYQNIVEKYEESKKNYKPLHSCIFKYSQLLFSVFFLISIPFGIKTNQLAFDAFLIKLFREVGKPIFSIKYLQLLLLNDHFQSLVYIFLCSIDNYNYYMLLPVVISIIIITAEDFKELEVFKKYISKINDSKDELILNKTHIEVIIGFLQIIGIIIGINTLAVPIIYWNFMRFRYIVNPFVYKSFEKLNKKVDIIMENETIPNFVRYITKKIQLMISYFGNINMRK